MKLREFYFHLGRPFSPIYSAAMRLREAFYSRGILKSYGIGVPVISVGNLTMGGTGKTPMVQYLARLLQEHGLHPAVVSRGYGGGAKEKINIVSDGERLLLDAEKAGDEPRFLAETLPGIPVLTGIVRRLPAQQAVALGADVILLDDGFQHLQLNRLVNLVLFSADRLAGNSRVFPGGVLREPITALHRATCFVLTGVHGENHHRAEQFAVLLKTKFPAIPVVFSGYGVDVPVGLSPQGLLQEVGRIHSSRCFAFCGIAHPQSFQMTIRQNGFELAGFLPLGDHQRYSDAILQKIVTMARQAGADFLVTTEKDLVKLARYADTIPMPLYGLRMQVTVDQQFADTILSSIRSWKSND